MDNIDIFADLPSSEPIEEVEEKIKINKKSFFDYLKNIYQTKDPQLLESDISDRSFNSSYSKWMIHRYLSFHKPFMEIIKNQQHILESMDNEQHYRYLFHIIPQNRFLFIKYVKKPAKTGK